MFKFSTDSMEMINVLIVLNLLKILAKLIPEIKENMRGFKCNKLSHRVKYWVMKINKINHINSWRFHMSFTICIFHVNARNIWSSNHTNIIQIILTFPNRIIPRHLMFPRKLRDAQSEIWRLWTGDILGLKQWWLFILGQDRAVVYS